MNKIKSIFAIGLLAVSAFSFAEEQQRYASITHTSSNFINQATVVIHLPSIMAVAIWF